jgi:hypothetical protein
VRKRADLRHAIGALLIFTALLVVPASAVAGGGSDLKLQFTGSDGYKFSVGGYGATTVINASKSGRSKGRAWSTYVARGKVTANAIHASFGALGRVAMRFHPAGGVTYGKRHRHCVGPDRYTIQPGVFVGSFHFRGEGGYTAVDVHRVKGKVVTPRRLRCLDTFLEEFGASGRGPAKKKAKLTRLDAFMRSGLTAILFDVSERAGKTGYLAEIEQTVGSVGVFRGVFVKASPATFAFDSALSFAAVTPPPPFGGSGSFQRTPTGAKSWTGSLAVSFPGAANVPLTDSRFETQLTRSW